MDPSLDLYPKSRSPRLDADLFRDPTAEYRGTPFWAWNNGLDTGQLLRQIDQMKQMGLGGFHMHPRTGLETPYLSEAFMSAVGACVKHARDQGMLAWLYDEDRWPSGFAGGFVTCDDRFRARHLLWTCKPYGRGRRRPAEESGLRAGRAANGRMLARYEVKIDHGRLAGYRLLAEDEAPRVGRVWRAYLEVATPASWFNNQTYVDTLAPAALRRFLEVTHNRYAACFGAEFGKTIPAIFTDEPQFTHKTAFLHASDTSDLTIPWTDDIPDTYRTAYGAEILDTLPEIFWEAADGGPSLARYRYHDHVCERFCQAFSDQIGAWCAAHSIALTGHMMEEPTLRSQTAAIGEAMRAYRSFQIPGIDLLCDNREYTTAKQAQSAAHQYGRPGVLSELYGVTNWDFDFAGHKGQGDWQAALGVTVRVPHLTWVSMAGEAKRDYPASIGYQSPWYREYPEVEDHFARVATVLTRGRPHVRVGVVHPIESYWLCCGPQDQTAMERDERDAAFQSITEWLLFGLVDFDLLCESLLPQQAGGVENGRLRVGKMAYECVVVPGMRTIRGTTLDRLEAFSDAGGDVVFVGEVPSLVDARPSERAAELASRTRTVLPSRQQVLRSLEAHRSIGASLADGRPADTLMYQMREDGAARGLFVCNTDRVRARDGVTVRVLGEWMPDALDTATGERSPLTARYADGWTLISHDFPAHGHLLLMLQPGRRTGEPAHPTRWAEAARLEGPVPVTLSEPNVLLLDQAEWRLADGPWRAQEEVLRLGNLARAEVGLGPVTGSIAQPWTDTEPSPVLGTVAMRFWIRCETYVAAPSLAIEAPEDARVVLDGVPVTAPARGWWVDEAICTITLPDLDVGLRSLVVERPLTRKTPFEWMYLLGDFGVSVAGTVARLTEPVRELGFGDWTRQGLPFYAGNVTYHCALHADGARSAVRVPHFRAPLLTAALDGIPVGRLAFAPFRAELGSPAPGTHRLDVTAFGNRFNAFGALHHASDSLWWAGPGAWRSEGDRWLYEYQLRPMGVLSAPVIERAQGEE